MKKFTSSILAIAAAFAANAGTVEFTYNRENQDPEPFGYNKKETINVAIRISDPALVGSKVTSMSVPLTTDLAYLDLENCSAFLTTTLSNDGKKNNADICTEKAEVSEEGMLTCTFSEPYTITEEGVYVGYTVSISSLSATEKCYPIAIVEGVETDGLYIFATRSVIKWLSKSADLGYVSAMVVTLDADLASDAAGLRLEPKYAVSCGKENNLAVSVANYGTTPISSIAYEYSFGSEKKTGEKSFDPAIDAVFGAYVNTTIPVYIPEDAGNYVMEIAITKVNGVDVSSEKQTCQIAAAAFPVYNRPLAEEFTGLWCGWCPRGYAAMETLKEEYPTEFIGLAYHNSDPMATMTQYPVNTTGFPTATVNRGSIIDAGALLSAWPAALAKMVDSTVDVDLEWANDEKTIIRANVKVRFLEDKKGSDYKMGACLVADDMTDPSWGQNNEYSTQQPTGLPILDNLFVGKPKTVYDLKFNDVVLAFPNPYGSSKGVPAKINKYEEVVYTEEFDLNAVRNLERFYANPIQNIEKLRVVGILFDNAGKPLNSATSAYSTAGGEIIQPSVAAPIVTAMTPAKDGNPASITFTCPSTYGGEEGVLIPNGTPIGSNGNSFTSYFRVGLVVDGEPYVFDMNKYVGLNKNEETVVYGGEMENTSFSSNNMTINVFAENPQTIGVQTYYVFGKTILTSEVTTVDANKEFSSIGEISAVDAAPVFYDLQGRRVSAPRVGQLLIRKTGAKTEKIRF